MIHVFHLRISFSRFDSNYHYVVPEFFEETDFKLYFNKAVQEFKEAKALGITTRPVILGPVSLVLEKVAKNAQPGFKPIFHLPKILPDCSTLLVDPKAAGADWVQVDEPIPVLGVAATLEKQFTRAYQALVPVAILLPSSFKPFLCTTIHRAHVDLPSIFVTIAGSYRTSQPPLRLPTEAL